ncbi:DNA replication and repair protein RecF [Lancefieldella sp. Marseille-Q7238]|uniref:DNA replication/repair protein RecF n=1 Tax=Lancefieldella sp. Marseille-Q7238 TaxID=3022127 RepID=UPI0024A942CE|nr:DNA replication and repair protein RecF [Lancefieldella sp. Marseille-Q7238]
MSLTVQQLSLVNFRSFCELAITFSEAATILVGKNAAGKTNVVESLQMVTTGYSFRKPTPSQLIHEGKEQGKVKAVFTGDGRFIDIACTITPLKRQFEKNRKKCRASEVSGTLMSILFTPDDLALIKRSASQRREEFDGFGRQANKTYAKVLASYTKSIEQRNRLLKEAIINHALLDAWDSSVALGGATLLRARLQLFKRLETKTADIYRQISGGENLSLSYVSTLGDVSPTQTKEELTGLFLTALQRARDIDIRRQQTTVGPHRDDCVFMIEGKDARAFGSQGQQRSVVLALKMAEVLVAEEILGTKPLLLLDDVMSELDASRREAIMKFALTDIQTVITTTNLGYFSQDILDAAQVVSFDD